MARHRRLSHPGLQGAVLCLGAVVLAGPARLPAQAPAPGPVEALRWTLANVTHDKATREREVRRHVAALTSLSELRQAVALEEWYDTVPDDGLRRLDESLRMLVAGRFQKRAEEVLRRGAPEVRLAMLAVLGDMGSRVYIGQKRLSVTGNLTGALVELMLRDEPVVRRAAARTLGQIHPQPARAVPALAELLQAKEPADRRAAAEGLFNLLRGAAEAAGPRAGAAPTLEDLVGSARAAIPAVRSGLGNADAEVRRQCAAALQEAATLLDRLLPGPEDQEAEQQSQRGVIFVGRRDEPLPELGLFLRVLKDQIAPLSRLLGDPDTTVCLAANRALESLADARRHQLRVAQAPAPPPAPGKAAPGPPQDLLGEGLRVAVRPLADGLSHQDVRVRLASLYVLESLEQESAPAVDAVVKALQDGNPFVRWGAVRTLGKMAPRGAEKAVPALGKLLADDNGDVRVTAAAALERFGPSARPAVPALRGALRHPDRLTRLWVLSALRAVGKEARPAAPELVRALADSDPEVRAAAVKALGRLGALPPEAAEGLRKALSDSDTDVRQAAADALLSDQ